MKIKRHHLILFLALIIAIFLFVLALFYPQKVINLRENKIVIFAHTGLIISIITIYLIIVYIKVDILLKMAIFFSPALVSFFASAGILSHYYFSKLEFIYEILLFCTIGCFFISVILLPIAVYKYRGKKDNIL